MGRGREERTCDVVDSVVDDEIHALLRTVVGSNICGGELLRHGRTTDTEGRDGCFDSEEIWGRGKDRKIECLLGEKG